MPYSRQVAPDLFHPHENYVVPPGTGTFGVALFLLSLGILFAGAILGYVLIRVGSRAHHEVMGAIHLPWTLWVSTVLIIASSFTIHYAVRQVRLERRGSFLKATTLTLILSIAFLLVQAPSLTYVLHEYGIYKTKNIYLYGFIFVLICLHAAHVLGGLIPLGVITYKAHRGKYDHENYMPVKHVAIYWHFLDAVWLIMFAAFLFAG